MSASNTGVCKVCGQTLAAHHLILRSGVAHAAIYDTNGRSISCSGQDGEYEYFRGRMQELTTIVRSLRWHAGRLRTKGQSWDSWGLGDYASEKVVEIEKLESTMQEYYAWAGEP